MFETNLDVRYEAICELYVERFLVKHGFYDEESGELNEWEYVGEEVGGIVCLGDYFIGFDDIRTDIDERVPKETYFEYYDYCVWNNKNINYKSFLKGAR